MKARRSWLLCLLVALGSCGLDGGSSGTGITTAQGNIVSVQVAHVPRKSTGGVGTLFAALRAIVEIPTVASAGSGVEDIRVSIEGTNFTTRTDANGLFSVRGSFAGPLGLIFQRPDDGLNARIVVSVPAGGTLTLNNVRVDGQMSQTTVDSQVLDFKGLVAGTNCPGDTIALVSQQRPDDGNSFTVRVRGSNLRDSQGNSVGCQDLHGAERVSCRGVVSQRDGSIGGAEVDVEEDSGRDGQDGNSGSGEDGGDTRSGSESGGGSSDSGTSDDGGTSDVSGTSGDGGTDH